MNKKSIEIGRNINIKMRDNFKKFLNFKIFFVIKTLVNCEIGYFLTFYKIFYLRKNRNFKKNSNINYS